MQEIVINLPDLAVSVGQVLAGAAIGAYAGVKIWWAKKSKAQKLAFIKDVNEKGRDGLTAGEIIELAEVHL